MNLNEETPNWVGKIGHGRAEEAVARHSAYDVRIERLENAERAYMKDGLRLVLTSEVGGQTVENSLYLTKPEALDLAALLSAEVSREMKTWPNGYSEDERTVWFAEIEAGQAAELDAADEQICRLHDEDPAGWAAYRSQKTEVERTALDAAMNARAERLGLSPSQGEGAGE